MAAQTYAALLRGINVGGKNKLPMAALKDVFTTLGHQDVVSYVQSGNVVFRCSGGGADDVAHELEQAVAKEFGLRISVLLRNAAQLKTIEKGSPFVPAADDRSKLHVMFLDRAPSKAAIARLDPERSPGDEFRVERSEIYLSYPAGSGRTKLTLDYFEKRLGVVGTARNWNTLLKLVELTSG
jgi:uncharacterized protein (DUF1697 family)